MIHILIINTNYNYNKHLLFSRHLKPLIISGVYNFDEEIVVLKFYNQNLDFSLVSISAEYESNRSKVPESEFKDISENEYKYNIEPLGKGKTYQFKVKTFEKSIYQNIFIVEILYIYLKDLASSVFSSKYSINVRIEVFDSQSYDNMFLL